MKTIHKYPAVLGYFKQDLPEGAKFLKFAVQDGLFKMWFEVDTDSELKTERFQVFATGEEVYDGMQYLDTTFEGDLVWHLYVY